MKKQVKATVVALFAFAIGLGVNNFAMSNVPASYKVGVVDVTSVVSKSSQVQALKKEQETKMKDLQAWLNKVRSDVQKQQTEAGKQKLIQKYDAEFTKKQDAIRKNYAAKLQAIDKSISAVIQKQAKALNYDLVLSKGVVLYGGTDITSQVSKLVK